MAARGQQFVLHENSHARRDVFQRLQVKILQYFFLFEVEKIGRDFGVRPARQASLIQLAQNQAEQGGRNGEFHGFAVFAGPRHKLDDADR